MVTKFSLQINTLRPLTCFRQEGDNRYNRRSNWTDHHCCGTFCRLLYSTVCFLIKFKVEPQKQWHQPRISQSQNESCLHMKSEVRSRMTLKLRL